MDNLTCLARQNHDEDHPVLLESLTIPYNRELDASSGEVLSAQEIRAVTRDMLCTPGRPGAYLELYYLAGELVGSSGSGRWAAGPAVTPRTRTGPRFWNSTSGLDAGEGGLTALCTAGRQSVSVTQAQKGYG